MKKRLEILLDIKKELERFTAKLDLAIEEQEIEERSWGCTKYPAAKRSALDLKQELTKITQDSKYLQNGKR